MCTSTSSPAPAEHDDAVKQTIVSVPIVDQSSNDEKEDREFRDWYEESQFLTLLLAANGLMLINHTASICLLMVSDIQFFTWRSKFENSSDVAIRVQSGRMLTSQSVYTLLPLLPIIAHMMVAFGPRGLIYLYRRVPRRQLITSHYVAVSFSIVFICVICPSKTAQDLVAAVVQDTDEYSASAAPNSFAFRNCVSIVFFIQHVILVIVLIVCKPRNFIFLSCDDDKEDQLALPPAPGNTEKENAQPEEEKQNIMPV